MVDHVIPDVPVRQAGVPDARTGRVGVEWVLTLPQRFRYLLAWRHDLCRVVVRVLLREVHRAGQRDQLERVCRYALRPPVAGARLHVAADGHVVLELRHPWADGTTHVAFTPTAFLARLAALIPRPRVNLALYHGLLAPRAAWRAAVVPFPAPPATADAHVETSGSEVTPRRSARGASWADLMRRAFEVDVLACPRCGGRLRLIAPIEASAVARRILTHLALPVDVPRSAPARAPPTGDDDA